jgi:hypothetical protein
MSRTSQELNDENFKIFRALWRRRRRREAKSQGDEISSSVLVCERISTLNQIKSEEETSAEMEVMA